MVLVILIAVILFIKMVIDIKIFVVDFDMVLGLLLVFWLILAFICNFFVEYYKASSQSSAASNTSCPKWNIKLLK